MITKIGFTSEEIKALPASALVEAEWLREIAYQLAKLNEQYEERAMVDLLAGRQSKPPTPSPRGYPKRNPILSEGNRTRK